MAGAAENRGEAALAAAYDGFLGAATARFAAATVVAAAIVPGEVVLDLGAGTGTLGAAADAAGGRVLLADRSGAMLDEARRRHPALAAVVADGADLPLDDGAIDVVLAGFYLNHVTDLPRALGEIRRVLRRGGRLCATVWGEGAAARHSTLIEEAAERLDGGGTVGARGAGRPATAALKEALAAAGFVGATVRHLPETMLVVSAEQLLEGMGTTTWQTAALIASMSETRLAGLVAALREAIEPYRVSSGFAIPAGARLFCATAGPPTHR